MLQHAPQFWLEAPGVVHLVVSVSASDTSALLPSGLRIQTDRQTLEVHQTSDHSADGGQQL